MNFANYPFTLRQVQYVLAIVQEGGFQKAALRCGVSQPSLSAQVAELERALNVLLFDRSRRTIALTPQGEVFIPLCQELCRSAEDAMVQAQAMARPFTGTWRIGVIPSIAPYWLPRASLLGKAQFPELHIHWIEEKTASLVEKINSGELHAAVVALEADLHDLEQKALFHDVFYAAFPKDHPLAEETISLRFDDLKHESLLLLEEGHCLGDQVAQVCSSVAMKHHPFRATSLATLIAMVSEGMGVTLLPALTLRDRRLLETVAIRRLIPPEPRRTVGVVWRSQSPLAASLKIWSEGLTSAGESEICS